MSLNQELSLETIVTAEKLVASIEKAARQAGNEVKTDADYDGVCLANNARDYLWRIEAGYTPERRPSQTVGAIRKTELLKAGLSPAQEKALREPASALACDERFEAFRARTLSHLDPSGDPTAQVARVVDAMRALIDPAGTEEQPLVMSRRGLSRATAPERSLEEQVRRKLSAPVTFALKKGMAAPDVVKLAGEVIRTKVKELADAQAEKDRKKAEKEEKKRQEAGTTKALPVNPGAEYEGQPTKKAAKKAAKKKTSRKKASK